MTELTRRMLGAPLPRRPIQVEVGLPEALRASCADQLTAALDGQLTTLLDELGLDRRLTITERDDVAGKGNRDTATVSIDGRPIAYLPRSQLPDDATAEVLCSEFMSRTLRRLPTLAGSRSSNRSTAAYISALGCRASLTIADSVSFDVDTAERFIDARTNEEIVVEVAASTMRKVAEDDVRALVDLRETDYRKRGVVSPDVRVVLTDQPAGSVRFRLNDVTLPEHNLGEDARWVDVVGDLGKTLAERRHWFVRMRHLSRVIDEDLAYVFPDLVAVLEANYSRAQVTACLRELVRSGRRIRNLPRIMWMLLEIGGTAAGSDVVRISESPLLPKARHRPMADRDPMVMAVRVRKLAAEEDWRLGNYYPPSNVVRLAAQIEERLVATSEGPALAEAEWAAVRAFATAAKADRVVTRSVGAIGPVRGALQAVERIPRVMASHELPPDADVASFPVLHDPQASL
ncbi:hypothetical protein AB0H36_11740 [Kribbella sp. NPDC050820]|uniref:hypothetical protein n=1 Tax=Kribbella sp. NPDC050820 TaxID=3155408 RepID=UPI0033DA78F0